MDKTGADFYYSIETMKNRLGVKATAIQIPMGAEADFVGSIDLIEMKAYFYDGNADEEYEVKDIPAEYEAKAKEMRAQMIDDVAVFDDEIVEKYLSGEELTNEEIKKCIRKGVINTELYPVLCGTAFKNKGVKKLLDAVVDFLPSPIDVPAIKGTDENGKEIERHNNEDEPFAALAFKVATDPFVGRLTYIRVYSGKIDKGTYVYNATKDKKERISRLVKMHSNNRNEIDSIGAGDICAVIGFKDTATGDTIADEKHPVILEQMQFADPVISLSVEPKTKADQEKMSLALSKLAEEDPTFKTYTDEETGQTIIAGMGELHLDVLVDRMRREFNVQVNVGAPQVSYRETFTQEAEAEGKYIKQSGGRGQYGHV